MSASKEHFNISWDGQLPLDQVYNWHAVHSPGIPTFVFQNENEKVDLNFHAFIILKG